MIDLQDAKDPDEIINKDPSLWVQAIQNSKYIIDYLVDRFEKDYDLKTSLGKRHYADRLASNIRRLADPVEQDHYIKILSKKLDIAEDAIRAKIEQIPEQTTPVKEKKTLPAPAKLSPRKRGDKEELEESLLALVLIYPLTRLALDDLSVLTFSSPQRQKILLEIKKDLKRSGLDIANSLTTERDYVNILLLRGEEENTSISPADRSLVAFGLARRLLITANKDLKNEIKESLIAAEKDGDVGLVSQLLMEYQEILKQEE
jgi:DNA primase